MTTPSRRALDLHEELCGAPSLPPSLVVAVDTSEARATLLHMGINQTRAALYLVCIGRAGYRDGARLIEFIEEWRRCVENHERSVTIEEFIEWTHRYGRRNAFYLLKLFRDTFPQLGEQGLPDGLMSPLIERLAAEVPSARVVT